MLKLSNITKRYTLGGSTIDALRGVDLEFRENEFVSILGPSGCGKTTTLNIIGGLDRYTSGDLIINGRSTKDYKDADWDAYRNHSIGFVFQSYNLIPHQTVLANVELALTLAGVSKAERRRRAVEALERVGLGDQLSKVPSQMSGGQMQRVAIARALINDPDILLADEPTGALDSETSVQVMELLKEVAQDRLVIMVTHNPELAQQYSTRIVTLKDGKVTGDSNPYRQEEQAPVLTGKQARAAKKPSMSFLTALSLSLTNLRTKMGRTVLTAFAGSIGIIGIALILALSTGINTYINKVQEDTLSSYPITIQAESTDMTALMASLMGARHSEGGGGGSNPDPDRVYASTVMYDMMDSMLNAETQTNNLEAFKEYLDNGGGGIKDMAAVHYSYDFGFDIYTQDENGDILKSDVMALMQDAMSAMYGGDYSSYFEQMGSMYSAMEVWEELLPGEDGELVSPQEKNQYELLYGGWPQSHDEVILFVDGSNEISDLMLYALGLMPHADMEEAMVSMSKGETVDVGEMSWSYEELCALDFKLILPAEYYQHDPATDTYTDMSQTQAGMDFLYNSEDVGIRLKVAGIARPVDGGHGMLSGGIGYTSALTRFAIKTTGDTEILKAQLDDPDTDVIVNLPFPKEDDAEPADEEKAEAIREHLSGLTASEKAAAYVDVMGQPSQEYVDTVVDQQMDGMTRQAIEDMIVEQYAGEMGVDGDTVRGYISDMSDEELFGKVEEAIARQVREQYAAGVEQQLASLPQETLAGMLDYAMDPNREFAAGLAMGTPSPLTMEQFVYLYDHYMPPTKSSSTYEDNLKRLGYTRLESPSAISIYATTFAQKDQIAGLIQDYNDGVSSEDDEITYTDYVALLMSSITGIISGISYLLIAFVSISLVVSSIMIGIITNISVLERTKEIGILRAVGASKRDVSRVFNAETLIVGLAAGLLGILVSVAATFPINALIHDLTGLTDLTAVLPPAAGAILVAISVVLTVFAGLIPSRGAAKKDPVEALRSE
ncbi:MAG: ABC transporter ATP-binding protein/permease [Oscillospiraceae bacterium]|jgi:putative ABC transport system permease protein|nr:ABC transporter ATP-binding protein/permease [Oscillospiraceae bacterium]